MKDKNPDTSHYFAQPTKDSSCETCEEDDEEILNELIEYETRRRRKKMISWMKWKSVYNPSMDLLMLR